MYSKIHVCLSEVTINFILDRIMRAMGGKLTSFMTT